MPHPKKRVRLFCGLHFADVFDILEQERQKVGVAMSQIVLFILEILGTVAFAVSGALVSIRHRLDVFGVVFIGCITAVGGGILRDIVIGNTPPAIFSNVLVLAIAAVTAVLVFVVSYINASHFDGFSERVEHINTVFDALGLAAFSVIGTETVCANARGGAVLAIALGMITGIGGGILRDVLVDQTPYVLKKHVYAVASLVGCTLYYLTRPYNAVVATFGAMGCVLVIRLLAMHFRWKLPRVPLKDKGET